MIRIIITSMALISPFTLSYARVTDDPPCPSPQYRANNDLEKDKDRDSAIALRELTEMKIERLKNVDRDLKIAKK